MNSEQWLNEEVYVGTLQRARRRLVIWRFAKYGIEPFIRSYGYALYPNTAKLSCDIATLLFHARGHTMICPHSYAVNAQNDYSIEHKQHYNHVIDYATWQGFWEEWNMWYDVSLDSPHGFYRRIDIQDYVWSQINLEASVHTQKVEEHMDGSVSGYGHEDGYRDDDGPDG
jgi:hypothetical protein